MIEAGYDDDDDLDEVIAECGGAELVDGFAQLQRLCERLRARRLELGFDLGDLSRLGGADVELLRWIDDGDIAAPMEALVYYATAVGFRLAIGLRRD